MTAKQWCERYRNTLGVEMIPVIQEIILDAKREGASAAAQIAYELPLKLEGDCGNWWIHADESIRYEAATWQKKDM